MNISAKLMSLITVSMFAMRLFAGEISGVSSLKIEDPPVLDGVLNEKCWGGAPAITEFLSLKDSSEKRKHNVWLAHDDTWLYMAVDVRHSNPSMLTTDCREHDGSISGDDSVEIFLDPGTDGELYFHYMLNAANVKAEQRAGRGGIRDRQWNAPWRSATLVTDMGWTAELAIPLAVLASYGDLERLRLNVCLNILDPVIDPQGIQVDLRREWLSWGPTRKSFHDTDAFGQLHLADLKDMTIQAPFLPVLSGRPTVGNYTADEDGLRYPVYVEVFNHSLLHGPVRVTVLDKPASGAINRIEKTVELAANGRLSMEVTVPVSDPASRAVEVLLEDPATGEIRQRDVVTDTSALTLMTAYPERNYFTSEQEVIIICEMGLPAEELRKLRAELKTGSGTVLAETESVLPLTRLAFDRAQLADGVHTLRVNITRADGTVLLSHNVEVLCRAPNPGREVKIDHANRVLLRNDEPFFPFGLIFHTTNEEAFKEVGEAGYNTLMWWWHIKHEDGPLYMDLARKHGLLMWMPVEKFSFHGTRIRLTTLKVALIQGGVQTRLTPEEFTRTPGDERPLRDFSPREKSEIFAAAYEKTLPNMLAGVRGIKDYDNLLCYSNFDEPFPPQFFDQWVQGLDLYNKVNQEDGYRPMYTLMGGGGGPEEFEFSDFYGPDPYWIPGGTGLRGTPLYVVDCQYRFDVRARPHRKPVMHVPVGETWSGMHQRSLTTAEHFCQTYLLLIHGAKGLCYFQYPFVHQTAFDALAQLARQMQTLGPAVVAPEVPQTITYSPGAMDYVNRQYPDIHVKLFAHPDGRRILLAANGRPYPVEVQYTVTPAAGSGTVKRLFADDVYPVNDGVFSDRLEAYGVRAYEVGGWLNNESVGQDREGLIGITVAMTGYPEDKPAEYALESIPRAGRADKRNILPNPSFEQATLPLWPDYYRFNNIPHLPAGPRIGEAGALRGLDTDNPWHGEVSVRLANPGFSLRGFSAPQVRQPRPMVFSVYMRADRDGVEAVLNPGAFGSPQTFKLTTEWARYSAPLTATPGISQYNTLTILLPGAGTIWVDAMQLEFGETPTEFEP